MMYSRYFINISSSPLEVLRGLTEEIRAAFAALLTFIVPPLVLSPSEALIIALPKHVTCVEIMDALALHSLPFPINIFFMFVALQKECLCCFGTWHVVFLEQLSRRPFLCVDVNRFG